MKFLVKKEDLFNGIKIVERATSMKGLQPVLANILIETVDNNKIKLTATDFDLEFLSETNNQLKKDHPDWNSYQRRDYIRREWFGYAS